MSCLSETIFAVHAVHSFSVTVSASIHSISASHRKKATHEYSAHEVKLPKQGRSVARPSSSDAGLVEESGDTDTRPTAGAATAKSPRRAS